MDYLKNNTTKTPRQANEAELADQYPKVARKIAQEQKPFTKTEIAQIIAEYHNGAMMKELSKKYGRHRSILHDLLVKYGIEPRRICPKTRGKEEEIAKLYLSGTNSYQIANKLGISQGAILPCLRKQNVAMRPAGRAQK